MIKAIYRPLNAMVAHLKKLSICSSATIAFSGRINRFIFKGN
jgi:hypothetical protein